VLATVQDATRRCAAALRAVLDRACAPARLAAIGATEHTGHKHPRNHADSRGNRVSTKPGALHKDLRAHLEPLLGRRPGDLTSGQATYDLRRLKHHGFIEPIPHSHRYRVTQAGHARALFLSRAHHRMLRDGLSELTGPDPNQPRSLRATSNAYDRAIDDLLHRAGLAA
jgi:hypothetical protein